MTTETWELPDVIELMIKDELDGVWTSLMGRIEVYDRTTQRARVQPVMLEGEQVLPLLGNVPVIWPRGAGGSLHFDLVKGDPVVVVFLRTNAASYLKDGVEGRAPQAKRKFSLSSAVAFPGGLPIDNALSGDAITEGATVLAGDAQVIVEAPEVKLGAGALDFVALAAEVDARFSELQAWIAGALNAALVAAGGAALPPVPEEWATTVPSVAASKVKVE